MHSSGQATVGAATLRVKNTTMTTRAMRTARVRRRVARDGFSRWPLEAESLPRARGFLFPLTPVGAGTIFGLTGEAAPATGRGGVFGRGRSQSRRQRLLW